jgi:hypothetical protein
MRDLLFTDTIDKDKAIAGDDGAGEAGSDRQPKNRREVGGNFVRDFLVSAGVTIARWAKPLWPIGSHQRIRSADNGRKNNF